MKLPCEMIQDLLPLYHDGVCSEISQTLVQEHLRTCEACTASLKTIDAEIQVSALEADKALPLKSIEEAWRKRMWKTFCKWFTIVVGSVGIIFALFCILTQWKFITVSTENITVKEIYSVPNHDFLIYRLNVPEGTYCSQWEWEYLEDGSGYQIPKRSVIELNRENQINQLDVYLLHDQGEMSAAQIKSGGSEITSWHIGKPGDSVLIWEKGMELEPAPEELLRRYGFLSE